MMPHSWRQRRWLSRYSELQIARQKTQHYINILRNRNKAGNVRTHITLTLRRALVTSVAMETQKCVPFVSLTYIWHCQQCNKYRKRCHGSTVTRPLYCYSTYFTANNMKHNQVGTYGARLFLSHFSQIYAVHRQIFVKVHSRRYVHWDPRWYLRIHGRTDVTKLMGVFHDLRKSRLKSLTLNDDFVSHSIENNIHVLRTSCKMPHIVVRF